MKGALAFDPRACAYGVATEAVQQILIAWSEIDWFEPGGVDDAEAIADFRDHQRRAHAHDPAGFPLDVDVRCVDGTHADFADWCARVRGQTDWDWRYGVLKALSSAHARARGWSEAEHAVTAPTEPRPGDLWFRYVDARGEPIMITLSVMPKLDGLHEPAEFYLSYAHGDVLDAIKWQLAERRVDMSDNPYVPLLRGYAGGVYPFSLGRDAVVLFRFR